MSDYKVLFLCDGRACDNPCNPACKYTSNPEHASYFEKIGEGNDATYWECDNLVHSGKGKDYDNMIPIAWMDEWSLSHPDGTVVDMLTDWILLQKEKWNPLNKASE